MAADPPPASALMEELVEEVLLRFPPADPSRLVGAALVCRRWCALVSGAGFRRRFRELHRAPPLLGLLCNAGTGARFVPAAAFRPPGLPAGGLLRGWRALDARHGRVLLRWDPAREAASPALVVWDLIADCGAGHFVVVVVGREGASERRETAWKWDGLVHPILPDRAIPNLLRIFGHGNRSILRLLNQTWDGMAPFQSARQPNRP